VLVLRKPSERGVAVVQPRHDERHDQRREDRDGHGSTDTTYLA